MSNATPPAADPANESAEQDPVAVLIRPDEPAILRDFVAYWASRRQGRIMPSFSDIDAIEIPWALPFIHVSTPLDNGDFLYRLVGEDIADHYHCRLKGLRLFELFKPESAAIISARWQRVLTQPAAYYAYTRHPTQRSIPMLARRLALPLGDDGEHGDHLIGVTLFEESSTAAGPTIGDVFTHDIRWHDLRRPNPSQ